MKIEVENIKGKTEETDNEDKEYNQEVPENSKMPKFSKASNLHSNSNKLNSSILVFLIIISFFSLFWIWLIQIFLSGVEVIHQENQYRTSV